MLATMATAGYSKTPLVAKLGIKPDMRVAVINEPPQLRKLLRPLPRDVNFADSLRGKKDIVMLFFERRAGLARKLDAAGRSIFPAGAIWVAWPKKASKVPTDITEDVVRELVLPKGLVDVKVCAIDETWSGLKVVWRKERR